MTVLQQFPRGSTWTQSDIVINPHEVYTLNFRDTNPNIYVINNPNMSILKIGISSMPRMDSYEFKVDYNTVETIGRPIGSKNIYILNDSSVKVKVRVFSIEKDFDPAILKNMNVSLEGYTIETGTKIEGIMNGLILPTSSPDVIEIINQLMKTDSEAGKHNIFDIIKAIQEKETVLNAENVTINTVWTANDVGQLMTLFRKLGSETSEIKTTADKIKSFLMDDKVHDHMNAFYLNGVNAFTHEAPTTRLIVFDYIMNDGSDFTIVISEGGEERNVLTVKAGEHLRDISFDMSAGSTLEFVGSKIDVRAKYILHFADTYI